MTNEIVFFTCLAVFITFLISLLQSILLSGLGSDQPVHIFLANVIKENKYKLFAKVPRIINDSYCGGYPLFLHWFIAIIGTKKIKYIEILLNPIVNTFIIITLAIVTMKETNFFLIEF